MGGTDNEAKRLRYEMAGKLSEYKTIFDKFVSGSATDEETEKMGSILVELEALQKKLGLGTRT